MPTFTVLRDESVLEDSVFDVDPITDTANPFGDYCVVKMDDRGGGIFDAYQRGTRIDVAVDPEDNTLRINSDETVTTDAGTTDAYSTVNNSGTYSNQGTVTAGVSTIDEKFTGYTVERRETEQSGADVLEVEAYSFDQFLRRNTVTNDQTGNLITEALADIIQTDTPVTYNAANINVGDDQELTRGYQGVAVEEALRDLAFKSQNENFGVNDDLEFFFRPRETVHIDRGVDNTQWFNYDIPELGKEAINEVEVWFDDGDRSVIVDDGTDKLDLQDNLGLPSPGTQRAELNRPLITNISDAEDIGRKYLTFRNATLSGTVTTFGLYDAEPGDTIDITIESRGIDAEFVIAATEYRWGVDETILTIVERRGDVDDILTEINDSVQRQEMESANRDAPKNRITTTNATAVISIDVVADVEGPNPLEISSGETFTVNSGQVETFDTVENAGTVSNQATLNAEDSPVTVTASADRLTNDGRRTIRNAWTGENPPDITTLVVGTDGSGLSRSNTALKNQVDSDPVSQSLPDSKTVKYSLDSGNNGIEELGLETAGGTLMARVVFDGAVDFAGEITVTLSVSNDDNVSRGVLTNDGQTAVRDILADNSPAVPTDYVYGSGSTAVSESDTALANQVVSASLEDLVVQSADTESEWQDITPDIAADEPLQIEPLNGRLEQTRVTWLEEAEDANNLAPLVTNVGSLSGDEGRELDQAGAFVELQWTPEHEVPADDLGAVVMHNRSSFDGAISISLDGTEITSTTYNGTSTAQSVVGLATSANDTAVTADEQHTLRIEATAVNSGQFVVDMLYAFDSRYNINFSPTFDSNTAAFDGPYLYADLQEVQFATVSTRRELTSARASQQWNNTDNNQFIELSNDDGSTFTRVNNSQTADVNFSSSSRNVTARIGLSRYTSNVTTTPTQFDSGQSVGLHTLRADVAAVTSDDINTALSRAVVAPGTATGSTIRESGQESNGTLLTRHLLAEFDVLTGQTLISSESVTFTSDN